MYINSILIKYIFLLKMNDKVKEIEEKLKKELIDYYDSLKFDIDIKAQRHELLNLGSLKQDKQTNLIEENVYLVEQIDRVLDSNLNDLNNFFKNWKDYSLEIKQDNKRFKSVLFHPCFFYRGQKCFKK